MTRVLEKTERRLGEKLFLKGERCTSPKCAMIRRAYPPGAHGKSKGRSRRRGSGSEFGLLMREKQKVRFLYGLDDKDIERYNIKASTKAGIYSANFLGLLETRLDNAVFRLGFAESRRIARQLVGHGHVLVNNRVVDIPSYQVKKGDVVSLKEKSLASPIFSELEPRLKKHEAPKWLMVDKVKKTGTVSRLPDADDAGITMDIAKIKEFYSR